MLSCASVEKFCKLKHRMRVVANSVTVGQDTKQPLYTRKRQPPKRNCWKNRKAIRYDVRQKTFLRDLVSWHVKSPGSQRGVHLRLAWPRTQCWRTREGRKARLKTCQTFVAATNQAYSGSVGCAQASNKNGLPATRCGGKTATREGRYVYVWQPVVYALSACACRSSTGRSRFGRARGRSRQET